MPDYSNTVLLFPQFMKYACPGFKFSASSQHSLLHLCYIAHADGENNMNTAALFTAAALAACSITGHVVSADKQDPGNVDITYTTTQEGYEVTGYTDDVPASFILPADQQGTIQTITYTTEDYTGVLDGTITKSASVYLPYGYSRNRKYNIVYMMHGAGGFSGDYFYRNDNEAVNILDHLIERKQIDPVIVVMPTYDAENNPDQTDERQNQELTVFNQEFRSSLIKAVESRYSTYAEKSTKKDFQKSRNHRAFFGFSNGAVTTWNAFENNLDYISYFAPMSGTSWINGDFSGEYNPQGTADALAEIADQSGKNFHILAMQGEYDEFFMELGSLMPVLLQYDEFSHGNVEYRINPGAHHNIDAMEEYFYNALIGFDAYVKAQKS